MKTFKDLEHIPKEKNPYFDAGPQAILDFDNGYSVSVIKGECTYGGDEGLYELAVMKDGKLCYDTHITDDVLGWLTELDVNNYMEQVQALEKQA